MKLIKRALITFALVRIAQTIAFGIRVGNLEQALKDKDNPLSGTPGGARLKSALEMFKGDTKEAQIHRAQALASKAELRKEMIESYV